MPAGMRADQSPNGLSWTYLMTFTLGDPCGSRAHGSARAGAVAGQNPSA